MSLQGTWADHIVIQAVADSPNLRIHIAESNANVSFELNLSILRVEILDLYIYVTLVKCIMCQLYKLNSQ